MAGDLKLPPPFFPKSVKIFPLRLPSGISVSNLVGRPEKMTRATRPTRTPALTKSPDMPHNTRMKGLRGSALSVALVTPSLNQRFGRAPGIALDGVFDPIA